MIPVYGIALRRMEINDPFITLLTRSSSTASGEGGVEAVYADEDIWLTRKTPGVLYDVETNIINIKKQNLGYYGKPKSPYELAMLFCMERLNKWLIENSQTNKPCRYILKHGEETRITNLS